MGSKVVTIEPDYSLWLGTFSSLRLKRGPIQVIFTWSKPKLERGRRNQTVTTCIMRQGVQPIGFGWAIENPNDENNQAEGIHWSFKRAIASMLRIVEKKSGGAIYGIDFPKRVDKAFRKALWEAMNK
jgi:hypothetical protein